MLKADTLFYNGKIYNTVFKQFIEGYFSVKGDKFLHIGRGDVPDNLEYENKVDLGGKWVIPGLVDCHMHIESSMIAPKQFAKLMVSNGVTTVVSEPHEIANVKGIDGVKAMINAADGAVMDIFYAIPSSVPSTSREFETAGAEIDLERVKQLAENPKVVCLGEVMNTNGVLYNPNDKALSFVKYLQEHKPNMPLEGHVPAIKGTRLNQYVYSGIDSDHTDHNLEEFMHRMLNGVFYQIQLITAYPEIAKAIDEFNLYENVAIVTDDTTPANLVNYGHLNRVVMKMVELGLSFENALYCATETPAKRMHFYDRGRIMPGKLADFCILDNTNEIKPVQTYKNGVLVYEKGREIQFEKEKAFPLDFYSTMKNPPVTEATFDIKAEGEKVTVKGLQTVPDTFRTSLFTKTLPVENGVVAVPDDICKLFVIERHGKNGNIKGTIAGGSCKIDGAVATSYSHDHHNITVLGSNNRDMALAANTVVKNGGGYAVVKGGKVLAQCTLEVCGLISEANPFDVAKDAESVEAAMRNIGYRHKDPMMSLSTLCLPVSMEIKLTDKGLIDVKNSKFIDILEKVK